MPATTCLPTSHAAVERNEGRSPECSAAADPPTAVTCRAPRTRGDAPSRLRRTALYRGVGDFFAPTRSTTISQRRHPSPTPHLRQNRPQPAGGTSCPDALPVFIYFGIEFGTFYPASIRFIAVAGVTAGHRPVKNAEAARTRMSLAGRGDDPERGGWRCCRETLIILAFAAAVWRIGREAVETEG
jgi:hypothetical protein